MTDNEINAAIAEACGWTEIGECENGGFRVRGFPPDKYEAHRKPIPKYTCDLNAMHEAEKVLSLQQEKDYFANIKEIVGDNIWYRTVGKTYRATARQRAEAFLWAIDKWKGAAE